MPRCRKCGGTPAPTGCKLCELFASHAPPGGTPTTGWPMVSEALAVDPSQVGEANARARRHGIPVHYDAGGFCHIPDRAARKKLLRLENLKDNNGGYGD